MNFRFLNIPVQIHPTFWIFLLFFTRFYQDPSIESVIVGMVLIISLLVHEYGHALTAVYFGASPTITLEAFGGKAHYNARGITPKQEFLITLNGPLLESLLIVLPYFWLKMDFFAGHPYIQYFLYVTMRLNIVWCLLNLIPLAPLDGGHLVRYMLEKKFGENGHKLSIITGLICVILVAPYLYYEGYFFFGTLLVIFGFQNLQILRGFRVSVRESSPFSTYLMGINAINDNEPEKAKMYLTPLLKSKQMNIKHSAIESLAQVYFRENEPQKAYKLLLNGEHQFLKEGKCLLCKLAFERKNYKLVGEYSRDVYDREPTYEIALLNSKAFAYLKQPALSGAWLVTASQFGTEYKENIKSVLLHEAYDYVRDQADFKQYSATIQ